MLTLARICLHKGVSVPGVPYLTKAEMELAREVSQREKETVKLRRKESVARLEDEMAIYDANVGGAHP